MRRWIAALGCALSLSCARELPDSKPPRVSMITVVERSLQRAEQEPGGDLRLVSLGEGEVIGLDPVTGDRLWRRPMRPFGAPTSYGRLVVIPVHGNRIAALDVDTGALQWESPLPGQALTGASVSERWVVVTALAERSDARSVLAMLSTTDGRVRWQRRSEQLLGVPAAAGRYAFVPEGDRVVAVALATGRLVSRMQPTESLPLQSVEHHPGALLATSGDALVDLYGGPDAIYRIRSEQFTAFREVDGIEPGLGHDDGVSLELLATTAGAPRRALYLGRRVVIGLRFDPFGRPIQARWVHFPYDQREYITMHAEGDRVWLVETTGALTVLDAHTGRPQLRRDSDLAPRGALFVGGDPPAEEPGARRSDGRDESVSKLVSLIEDPDERLLPAQQLGVDLLWRHETPQTRTLVRLIAIGALREADGPATQALRSHAASLLDSPWGPSTRKSLQRLRQRLAGPGKLDAEAWSEIRREVLAAGSPGVLARVGALLDDPAVPGEGLAELARTIRDLGDSRAVPAVSTFVLKYYVDPDVVSESKAMFYALEYLLAQGLPPQPERVDPAQSQAARDALQQVLDNEFALPVVRRYIEDRLPQVPE